MLTIYPLKLTVILQGNTYPSSKLWVFNLLAFVVMSGKSKTWDSYCLFSIVCKYSLCNMFLKSFISSYSVYHDKTGLKCYFQKAGREDRINPSAVSLAELFMDCHKGELVGKGLQTSSSCHTLMQFNRGGTCRTALVSVYVFPCHSLQAIFDTIAYPPLPVCHLLTFHLPIKSCCFCSTCHVSCMLDCCWSWGSRGEQTSHWHCFVPGRHAGERSRMGGCTPLKGPRRSESFYDSSGVAMWIWEKPGHQGWPDSCWVPALPST